MSTKKYSYRFILGFLLVIFVLHLLGMRYGWYWHVWGYDKFVHLLGGFWIASLAIWFFRRFPQFFAIERHFAFRFLVVLGAVALAGVAWEFFEFSLDQFFAAALTLKNQLGLVDTMSDLAFDLAGGALFNFVYLLV